MSLITHFYSTNYDLTESLVLSMHGLKVTLPERHSLFNADNEVNSNEGTITH